MAINNVPKDGNSTPQLSQTSLSSDISSSTNVKASAGFLLGWVVNSHTSGTAKFWDNTAGSGTVLFNTITFASGPSIWALPSAVSFATGLFVTLSTTIDMTVMYI